MEVGSRLLIGLGALYGFGGVALGAFAAHGLQGRLGERALNAFHTAVDYQLLHAVLLLVIGLWLQRSTAAKLLQWAGISIAVGVMLFSGSLYLLSTLGWTMLGPVTPVGGLCLLTGWLLLLSQAVRK